MADRPPHLPQSGSEHHGEPPPERDRYGLLPGMGRCPLHGDFKRAPFPYHPGCPTCVYGSDSDPT